jgi:hypothetical protein
MEQKDTSRRDFMKKTLAAGGAISVVSFLPKKWLKPAVESVALPVHAQISAVPTATASPTGRVSGVHGSGVVDAGGSRGLASMRIRMATERDYSVTVNLYATDSCPALSMEASSLKMARPKESIGTVDPPTNNPTFGTPIDTDTTGSATGSYEFVGLAAGFYIVEFEDTSRCYLNSRKIITRNAVNP